ncbi:S9 family peptidase [Rhodococcus sp. PAMC28707]|uniref:S9 family peptidase n=1 Tax=unclassified Rhodococcus (in: high G+C Gram-positive bacteria) TaxID=192944 RepID=UPI00109D96F3|nr:MULTISPECIES: alpha/beta fold hydrolase [unclassified Rhodococcus (in: high G+C Gram-positive bacteria)]QCB51685.1 S9 family peptidase [Rhodococcus sp. PAMC28705]QCB60147.1 S9 family peptidase [Rhodococcus sp. PAMC28707]
MSSAPRSAQVPPAVTTVFDDLDLYVAVPRVSDMAMSVDGSRVVVVVSRLDADKATYVGALWEVDVEGSAPARRLTWSEHGESGPAFTAEGDLYFLRRTSPDDESAAVWCLPAGVGEAYVVSKRGAGYSGLKTANHSSRFVAMSDVMPSAGTEEVDERLRQLRKDKKVGAILHTGYPIRHWDHDLGPATPHLYAGDGDGDARRVTANAEGALHEASYSISADGSFVISTWTIRGALATSRTVLVRVDLDTGTRTTIVDDDGADLGSPSISPDGSRVAFVRESLSTPEQAPRMTLQQYVFEDRTVSDLAPEWDRWPSNPVWLSDGTGVLVVADDRGRAPVFLVRDGVANPVTTTDSAYSHLHVASSGVVFALEASYRQPLHPVRIDIESGVVHPLALEEPSPVLPGTLTEVETVTEDGQHVRAWLALPADASEAAQAPLLLWVHGGPLSSWNTWSWRWNPWVMVARGYAVLLPDPALSTGYGQSFVDRGWGRWGKEPYTDLLAVTDAAAALEEVDGTRTAAMGGSFGGYMANWIAGHTDRFDAIVTHAGLWALDQFGPTTDAAYYWQREMSPEMAFENSPHLYVADIDTPMLVIHGDKDYRVPIGEGLRLWFELLSESGLPTDDEGKTDHRLLYFPSENHWVLAPQHAKIWYEVVLSFLSEHVLGIEMEIPEILG